MCNEMEKFENHCHRLTSSESTVWRPWPFCSCVRFLGFLNKIRQTKWLKQQKFSLFQLWRPEVWNKSVGHAHYLWNRLRQNPLPPLPTFWWMLEILGVPWRVAMCLQFLPLSSHSHLPCVYVPFPLLGRQWLLDLGAHPYPVWPHLN